MVGQRQLARVGFRTNGMLSVAGSLLIAVSSTSSVAAQAASPAATTAATTSATTNAAPTATAAKTLPAAHAAPSATAANNAASAATTTTKAAAAPAASSAPVASTKPSAPSTRDAARAREAEAVRKLNAPDAESVRAGIDALREISGMQAERALIARVEAGLPPALVTPALDALVALGSRRALPVITELTQHRRGLVRQRAISALAALETKGARTTQTLLLAALEDPDAEVRSAAATALGRVGTPAALPALFAAYDRGVTTALPTIAQLAGRESVEPVFARMPQGMVEPVEPVLDGMLERGKLSAFEQVKLVKRLAAMATPSARHYLLKWLDRIKLSGAAPVKNELFQALKALDAGSAPVVAQATAPAPAAATPAVTTPAATPAVTTPVVATPAVAGKEQVR
jgi:hypothetical protein